MTPYLIYTQHTYTHVSNFLITLLFMGTWVMEILHYGLTKGLTAHLQERIVETFFTNDVV